MTNILAFTPTLNLDGQQDLPRPCIDRQTADRPIIQRGEGLHSIRTFGWLRCQLRRLASLIRYSPSLSETTLDQTGVAEFLRRR